MLKLMKGQNAIELYDVYESEESVHLVMEYIKGVDLFTTVKNKVNYTETDARRLMKELLKIIQKFHDKQIVHRDITPENIMITLLHL